jgi:hypothetical protein
MVQTGSLRLVIAFFSGDDLAFKVSSSKYFDNFVGYNYVGKLTHLSMINLLGVARTLYVLPL